MPDRVVPAMRVCLLGWLLPTGVDAGVWPLLVGRGLRGFCDGFIAVLLPAYLLALGFGGLEVGLVSSTTLIGSALTSHTGVPLLSTLRAMFAVYALTGVSLWWLYRRLPDPLEHSRSQPAPLGASRRIVTRLALLFSVDAFAGGLVVNSLLSLWLMQRFGLSLGLAGQFFFCTGLLSAGSQLVALPLSRKFGLLNTMVFTHIPSSLCLIAAAFTSSLPLTLTLLLSRSALSEMDVPTRTAYVMGVVTPPERPAAASFTAVPRSLAAALSPTLAGILLTVGWAGAPLVFCGVLKIGYDLTLLGACRQMKPDA